MKTYEVICNEGSLGGVGTMQKDIIITIQAESQQEAEYKFDDSQINKVYGRHIKSIKEISELNTHIENNVNKYVFNK